MDTNVHISIGIIVNIRNHRSDRGSDHKRTPGVSAGAFWANYMVIRRDHEFEDAIGVGSLRASIRSNLWPGKRISFQWK
jgi:hypothetical protein